MNSIYHIIVRRLSTQQNHYKLVVIGAACGGLACASKLAKKLPNNQIAIVDKNDVFMPDKKKKLLTLIIVFCFVFSVDTHLSTRLDVG